MFAVKILGMVAAKVEHKFAILLSPPELNNKCKLIESLTIEKSASDKNYKVTDLDAKELSKNYSHLPSLARELFLQLSPDAVIAMQQKLRQPFAKQKIGKENEILIKKSLIRHLHQLFEKLKPFRHLVKWYHKIPGSNTKNFKTSPCIFSSYRTQLSFAVQKKQNDLVLITQVVLNGAVYNVKDFNRYHFLLESNNEYFLLSYKDYQTLEWLAENNREQYKSDPAAFSQHLLARHEKDYTVNRNDCFSKKEVTTLPSNQVMLNELNNAFVMFTPQWLYDGFVVEGPWQETHEIKAGGEVTAIKRNKEAEESFLQMLVSLHPNFANQRNGYYYVSFADAQKKQWFLKAYHQLLDAGIELVGMDMLNHFRYSQHKVQATVEIKNEVNGKVLMKMNVFFGKEEIRLAELQKMLLAGQRAVLLKDNSLAS